MEEKNIQIDLCRNGGVVAQLHLPLKFKNEKADFQMLESILNETCVKKVIETVTGCKSDEEASPALNDNQYAEWKHAYTEDEMCNVVQQLLSIEKAVTEIRKTLQIGIETPELPF